MTEKSFMTVEEVAAELRVSKSKAYQIVRELNAEMQKQGYLTVAGRVNATFFLIWFFHSFPCKIKKRNHNRGICSSAAIPLVPPAMPEGIS